MTISAPKTFVLFLSLFLSHSIFAQWVRYGHLIDTDLKELHFTDPLNGTMVSRDSILGNRGKIWRTTDAGINWQEVYHDTTDWNWIDGVDFGTALHGIAVGRRDLTYFTTDGGWTWDTTSHSLTPVQFETVEMVDQNIAYAGNWRGEIMKTTDGGLSWNKQFQAGSTWWPIMDIKCLDANNCYASGWGGTYRTMDGGQNWTRIDAVQLQDMYCWNSQECIGISGYFSGTKTVWRTSDGGTTWSSLPLPNDLPGKCIDMYGAEGYIGGGQESIFHTQDSGATWTLVHVRSDAQEWQDIESIQLLDANHGYACGDSGLFLRLGSPVSITDEAEGIKYSVFPNPMETETRFVFSKVVSGGGFALFDMGGKLLAEEKFGAGMEFHYQNEGLAAGVYSYQITIEGEAILSGKLLKR